MEREGFLFRIHDVAVNRAPRYLRLGSAGMGTGAALNGDWPILIASAVVFAGTSVVGWKDKRIARGKENKVK